MRSSLHKRKIAWKSLPILAAIAFLPGSVFHAKAAWRPTGPFGGDADVVRVVPTVPGMVVAAARNGLLFESTNGGAGWSNIPFTGQFTGVLHALEIDPRPKGAWYVGVEGDRAWTSGVYKTSDQGRTWTMLPGLTGKAIWSLALSPEHPDVIAAGAADGVFRSDDAGAHWGRISPETNLDLRPVVSLTFDPSSDAVLYAGTTHLPWKTTDGGANWKSIHTGMLDDSDVFSIQVDAKRPETVYASACSGLYRSPDGAGHWTKFTTPPGAFRTYFVAIDPRAEGVIFAGTSEGLLRSGDNGRVFREVSAHAVKSIAFDPAIPGRVFFASTTGGILVSTDGGKTLRETNFGFTNRNFTVLTGAGGIVYANSVYEPGSGGIYRTDDLGLRWSHAGEEPAGQEILAMSAVPDQPATLFAAGYHGVLKSVDGGKSWVIQKELHQGDASDPAVTGRINSLVALNASTLLIATDRGVFRSGGAAWQPVTPAGLVRVQSLQQSGKNTVAALAGQKAFASSDGGMDWKECGQPSPTAVWYGLAFDGASGAGFNAAALAATSEGLFRSNDGCSTWKQVNQGLQSETVSVVLFHPTRAGEAFASQGGRVFSSSDSGLRWFPLNDEGRGASWPSALLVLPAAPERLFALFPRRGIFSNTVEGTLPPTAH
ncbi:MAG TPA: hypothetical protein VG273_01850 [Bryobacteraceae bacterium]|jgi:photosystem II stability/assembly factor-like uncharacterized protein|nr:hypothetical protein [Bryobacteraceae bacterium]